MIYIHIYVILKQRLVVFNVDKLYNYIIIYVFFIFVIYNTKVTIFIVNFMIYLYIFVTLTNSQEMSVFSCV